MKKITLFQFFAIAVLVCVGYTAKAQFAFTNTNSLITTATHSGCAMTVVDVNNDGLDDILLMDASTTLVLELQNQNGTYTRTSLGNISGNTRVWGMAAADVDHNGWKDVVTGTNGTCYLVKLFSNAGVVTSTTTTLAGSYFVQNITFGDFNNDGWVDVSVCDDNAYDKIYQNTAGTLSLSTTLINTNINPGLLYGNDPYDSGNYGSVWTDIDNDGDLDLYICHCRQSTNSNTDQRRRDRLFINNGSNVYTEAAQAHGFEVTDFKQTWTTSFGDMDNDGDMDVVMTNHGENGQILQNNGAGMFTDITAGSGFNVAFDAIESQVEDFDNDGWLDILVTGPGWIMYHNNHNGTYTSQTGAGMFAGTNLLSFGSGDLNHDGKVDIYASYGGVYNVPSGNTADVLYLNSINNGNHFIDFNLTGTISNLDAIGAKVTIYGAFGQQEREVRSGESYGTSNTLALHFGLGANTTIDSARINWPSHLQTHFGTLSADQFVTAVEGGCTLTGNVLSGGPYSICAAQPQVLTGAAGFSTYLWSNGATTPSITVTGANAGSYSVQVTNAAGCTSVSPSVQVILNPTGTPTITATGPANSCPGTVTLTSSTGVTYSWAGPAGFSASTQNITPMDAGAYTVTTSGGVCGTVSSAPTTVAFLPAPSPTTTGAASAVPAALTLTATGSGGTLSWYDLPSAGILLTTGASYTTPVISTTTTYYVEEATTNVGASGHTGQMYHTGNSNYSTTLTTNGTVDFDVLATCTLQSVKVYTDSVGVREIDLKNSAGVVIDSISMNFPADTTIVTLNWVIPVGTNYHLTTKTSVNNANWGVAAPYLRRSSNGVAYPYTINNLVSLTGSNQGGAYYYYFYDWVLQGVSTTCTSSRVPVVGTIGSVGVSSLSENNGIQIYPNPANDEVNVKFDNSLSSSATVELTDIAGRLVKSWVIEKPNAGQEMKLNVSTVNAGTYLLNIKTDTKKLVQKLVLTK